MNGVSGGPAEHRISGLPAAPARAVVLCAAVLALLYAAPAGHIAGGHTAMEPAVSASEGPQPVPLPVRPVRRLFVSGHSLTDHPLPEYLAALAQGMGRPLDWNMQGLQGSSIKDRTMGSGPVGADGQWTGYAAGLDRDGQPLNALAELARHRVSGSLPYDTLLITEQHSLLGSIVWNDSLRFLRDFHDRIIAHEPQAQTYLFEAWMTVADLDDPASWIAYERAATPVWGCVAARINHDLAMEGRTDRLITIPAGLALTALVSEALSPRPVPGLRGRDTRSTLGLIFRDDVHLTDAGAYYIALVTSAYLQGAPAHLTIPPRALGPDTAKRLQQIAEMFLARQARAGRDANVVGCAEYVSERFAPLYLAYQRDLQLRDGAGIMAWLKWAKLRWTWPRLLRRRDGANPFYIGDPAGS